MRLLQQECCRVAKAFQSISHIRMVPAYVRPLCATTESLASMRSRNKELINFIRLSKRCPGPTFSGQRR